MDIEKILKDKHPTWTPAMVTARRIEGFNNLYGGQRKYHYYKEKKYSPQSKSIEQISKEFDIKPIDIYNEL